MPVIDQIERDFLSSEGINMLIHFDPVLTDDSAVSEIRRELEQTVRLIDERLSVHDLAACQLRRQNKRGVRRCSAD